jgi:cofilin
MASGVHVKDECKDAFNEIKLKKNMKYIIYRLSDDLKFIEVAKRAEADATYEDFVEDLKQAENAKQCRYAIFDAKYQKVGSHEHQKLFFLLWSPETAVVRQKMVYASSKSALKSALGEGMGKEIQAHEASDLNWDNILEQISRNDKH